MMKDQILSLEKKLFQFKYMSDRKWLEEIIHDHFKECGKSGCFFDKKQTISSLIEFTEDRRIDIYNFEYTHIDNNTYMVHYVTKDNQSLSYRTSIWYMENHLKLFYHQASRFQSDKALIKF